jgi:hypothetical protein
VRAKILVGIVQAGNCASKILVGRQELDCPRGLGQGFSSDRTMTFSGRLESLQADRRLIGIVVNPSINQRY